MGISLTHLSKAMGAKVETDLGMLISTLAAQLEVRNQPIEYRIGPRGGFGFTPGELSILKAPCAPK